MKTVASTDRLLSPQDVAARLHVTEVSVRRWVAQGQLEAVRLGDSPIARIRIREDALERFVQPARPVPDEAA